eukprot:Stramenopile-MAST_4_protein_4092
MASRARRGSEDADKGQPRRYSEDGVPDSEDEDLDSDGEEFGSANEMDEDGPYFYGTQEDMDAAVAESGASKSTGRTGSSSSSSSSSEDDGSSESESEGDGVPLSSDDEDDPVDNEKRRANLVDKIMRMSDEKKEVHHDPRPDSQFAPLSAASGGSGPRTLLSADTLLGALDGGEAIGIEGLKSTADKVNAAVSAASVPLPRILTERATRKAGYVKSKETATQWIPLVKEHREKEQLTFKHGGDSKPEGLTNASLSDKFSASNEMESEIQALLDTSGMDERDLREKEDMELEMNNVTKEEIEERRAQMAKMRSMLFYQEQKSKRLKKIKSKLYHKIRNKQLDKFNKVERERLRSMDPALAKKLDEEDAKKYAEERMTLRHRNMSKWAKNALKRGQVNREGTREAIEESLRLGQELKRKQQRVEHSDESSSDDDGSSSDGGNSDEDDARDPKAKAQAAVEKLVQKMGRDGKVVPKGIMGLKFMQRATDAQKQQVQEDATRLLRELDGDEVASEPAKSAPKFGKRQLGQGSVPASVPTSRGGKTFRERIGSLEGSDEEGSDDSDGEAGKAGQTSTVVPAATKKRKPMPVSKSSKEEAKRKLKQGTFQLDKVAVSGGFTTKMVGAAGDSNANTVTSTVRWDEINLGLKPLQPGIKMEGKVDSSDGDSGTNAEGPAEVQEDADAPTTPSTKKALTNNAPSGGSNPWLLPNKQVAKVSKKEGKRAQVAELDTTAVARGSKTSTDALDDDRQKTMVRLAFAGDDVEAQFAKEKAAAAEEKEGGKKAVPAMAGWGSWAGSGAPISKPRRPTKGKKWKEKGEVAEKKEKRRDADLKHVIICEKRNKQAAKYNVEVVPHPFKTRAQYEASLRNPIGPEWNTSDAHSTLTRPKVVVDAGTVIAPIKMSDSYKRKLKDTSAFDAHKKKQRIMRHAKRKTKL